MRMEVEMRKLQMQHELEIQKQRFELECMKLKMEHERQMREHAARSSPPSDPSRESSAEKRERDRLEADRVRALRPITADEGKPYIITLDERDHAYSTVPALKVWLKQRNRWAAQLVAMDIDDFRLRMTVVDFALEYQEHDAWLACALNALLDRSKERVKAFIVALRNNVAAQESGCEMLAIMAKPTITLNNNDVKLKVAAFYSHDFFQTGMSPEQFTIACDELRKWYESLPDNQKKGENHFEHAFLAHVSKALPEYAEKLDDNIGTDEAQREPCRYTWKELQSKVRAKMCKQSNTVAL